MGSLRTDALCSKRRQLTIGIWNVKGLTDEKLITLCMWMSQFSIDVLCLQETRVPKAQYFIENGFQVVLSGKDAERCWSGVGFLISPRCASRVVGFLQFSERLMSLKLSTAGGKIGLINAYAPHNALSLDVRVRFYDDLGSVMQKCSVNGAKYLFGDFNARIGRPRAGEEHVFGPWWFGAEVSSRTEIANRELLYDFCLSSGYAVCNTFERSPASQKVTFFKPGSSPLAAPDESHFAQLDLVLAPQANASDVMGVQSVREAALATDHFLVICQLNCRLQNFQRTRPAVKDCRALMQPFHRQLFVRAFNERVEAGQSNERQVESTWHTTLDALRSAEAVLPDRHARARKPWTSEDTLNLIDKRSLARRLNDYVRERTLHRLIRKSVKADKASFLDSLIAEGSWSALKRVYKPRKPKQGRLCNSTGNLVSSEDRADALADYFEHVQWAPRNAQISEGCILGDTLPVNVEPFTIDEVKLALKNMRNNKAPGPDGVRAEFLMALTSNESSVSSLTAVLNQCWHEERTPAAWHLAHVSAIYKKGPVHDPANFRPISLLDVTYKLLASIVRSRLVRAGAEERITQNQFGFRSGLSTQDAIFILRRKIEVAWAQRHGSLYVLALDWAMAFDSLDPGAMVSALRRFGLPGKVLNIIAAIYSDRHFKVHDSGRYSSERDQNAGISQGCPLSPFLFVMVMTVVLVDAIKALPIEDQHLRATGSLMELLYADDTLILSESPKPLERLLASISEVGARYGLKLHWGKLHLLCIRGHGIVKRPDGSTIEPEEELTYLGATINKDGGARREIARRIAIARREFLNLSRIWRHSSLGRKRRTEIFNTLVTSKLLYGLATIALSAADRRRIDGFQNQCLRRIWGILPSYISRKTNVEVLRISAQTPLSKTITRHQLLLYGKAARCPAGSAFRDCCFCPGTLRPTTDRYVRRIGRPKLEWATQVRDAAVRLFGSCLDWEKILNLRNVWETSVFNAFG